MRPSVYLQKKAEALYQALDYMSVGSYEKTINEKILVFLSQIDFWDWEIEELIYTFKSFNERSKIWESTDLDTLLLKQKFVLNKKTINELENSFFNKKWRNYYRAEYNDDNNEVFAPYKILNKIINKWNSLLEKCSKRLMSNIDVFGIQSEDINKFKKEQINIEE